MAINILKHEVQNIINRVINKRDFFKGVAGPVILEFNLGGAENLKQYQAAGKSALEDGYKQAGMDIPGGDTVAHGNVKKLWEEILKKVHSRIATKRVIAGQKLDTYRSMKSKKTKIPNSIYFGNSISTIKKGYHFPIVIYCNKSSWGEKILRNMRKEYLDAIYKEFKKEMNAASKGKAGSVLGKKQESVFGGRISRAHDKDSTRGMLGVQEEFGPGGSQADNLIIGDFGLTTGTNATYSDFYKSLKGSVKVDWGQKAKKEKYAHFNVKNVITVNLGRNLQGTKMAGDATNLQNKLYSFLNERGILVDLMDAFDINAKQSEPQGNQILEDVQKDILKPFDKRLKSNRPRTKSGGFDMRFKANRGLKNLKSYKNKKRDANLIRGTRVKPKVKVKVITTSIRKKGNTTRGEKGQGKEASTNNIRQLETLKALINKNLTAEVEKHMHRPSLRKDTGKFSESVELTKLMEGRDTILAQYTYLLSPYQTFENTGKRRWPLGYNPKPLIEKSIRNLAKGRINIKKLTYWRA